MRRVFFLLVLSLVSLAIASTANAGALVCQEEPTRGRAVVVEIVHGCYLPGEVHVAPGSTVEFVNRDPAPHNLVGHGLEWGTFDAFGTDQWVSATFDEPGLFPFACTIHPGMVGVVVVEDVPPPETSSAFTPSGPAFPTSTLVIVAGGMVLALVVWRVARSGRLVRSAG
ncbi:MAG: plastocyanin/azurin family copper-binding protein [Acidimicrobiia bacterium]|nr:plastocyanin/azurin family copper-binding protein [Acidimicrobiia bacterium]MDH4306777.1 plastocyanin/azurin family copper-binding protein [Acidimicrobiia bacterium]MDH5295273.1 plastocyanin/azurin family copper-binding protein [Acidimicrobiia bacterium]